TTAASCPSRSTTLASAEKTPEPQRKSGRRIQLSGQVAASRRVQEAAPSRSQSPRTRARADVEEGSAFRRLWRDVTHVDALRGTEQCQDHFRQRHTTDCCITS